MWIYDLGSKVPTRLTSDAQTNDRPEWTVDGQRVAYRRSLGTYWLQRADGSDKAQLLLAPGVNSTGAVGEIAMVPDGKRFIARIPQPGTGMDLFLATIGDSLSKQEPWASMPNTGKW